jgi:hypothetical protein
METAGGLEFLREITKRDHWVISTNWRQILKNLKLTTCGTFTGVLASSIAGTDLRLESARIRLDENVNKISTKFKQKIGAGTRGVGSSILK